MALLVLCVSIVCRRRDEEGRSDSEEDINGGSESLTVSEEEDNEEGEIGFTTVLYGLLLYLHPHM